MYLCTTDKKFRADVANTLIKMGVNSPVAVETSGIPHYSAKYNGVHFVAVCFHTSSDVTSEHVTAVTTTKQSTGASVGLLIVNQDTIPTDHLVTLNNTGCEFIPVGRYGEEGWKERMKNKIIDVLPKDDCDDNEVSYLQ